MSQRRTNARAGALPDRARAISIATRLGARGYEQLAQRAGVSPAALARFAAGAPVMAATARVVMLAVAELEAELSAQSTPQPAA